MSFTVCLCTIESERSPDLIDHAVSYQLIKHHVVIGKLSPSVIYYTSPLLSCVAGDTVLTSKELEHDHDKTATKQPFLAVFLADKMTVNNVLFSVIPWEVNTSSREVKDVYNLSSQ